MNPNKARLMDDIEQLNDDCHVVTTQERGSIRRVTIRQLPDSYYDEWERLFEGSKRAWRDAKSGRRGWDAWRAASRRLREHEERHSS